jgi:hypothetical protein
MPTAKNVTKQRLDMGKLFKIHKFLRKMAQNQSRIRKFFPCLIPRAGFFHGEDAL